MFDVITIGTATQDVFLRSGDLKSFAPGAKLEMDKPFFVTGGGAINAAITFARQGLKSAALFRIGEDEAGAALWEEMKKEEIDFWKIEDENDGTATAAILLYPSGERTIFTYRGAAENFKINEIPFPQLKARWISIFPSRINPEVMLRIIEHCYALGCQIAFNPSRHYLEERGRNLRQFLNKVKVLVVNKEEAGRLTGADPENVKEVFAKLDKLVQGIAVMTDGPRGVWVSDGQKIYHAGIFLEKAVVDRTGAGDAFLSGFVSGLILKDNIEYAIRLGSANATSVVEQIGAHTGVLTKTEFEKGRRWGNLKIIITKS